MAEVESKSCGKKRDSSQEKLSHEGRQRSDLPRDEIVLTLKRKNFAKACFQVSFNTYFNYTERFDLLSLPLCVKSTCVHKYSKLKQVPVRVEKIFNIEMNLNVWYEALDISLLSINSKQYLSRHILQEIIEIILNAHKDSTGNYSVPMLLRKCQQILSLHFSMHPPCTKIGNIRKCYIEFLTSPMDKKENTFTNRSKFQCSKGFVNYSLNRLEAELDSDSNEEALFNMHENIPEELSGVQVLHWQEQKFHIFEMLNRTHRIERLMMVLESIIELVKLDLTIWYSRYSYSKNVNNRIRNGTKRPIMAIILWPENIYTGGVTIITRQILRLFVNFIHLQYPERHIQTMTSLLNIVIQTFYISESNWNSDYPSFGKNTSYFATEFYNIIKELPQSSILRILEKIKPSFMRYLIIKKHLQSVLQSTEDDIIAILIYFIKMRQWEKYSESEEDIPVPEEENIKPSNLLSYLTKYCISAVEENKLKKEPKILYPKLCTKTTEDDIITQKYITHLLFVGLQAYFDTYSLQNVHETWDMLNDQIDQGILNSGIQETDTCCISKCLAKKYRSIFKMLKDLVMLLHQLKNDGKFPEILNVFTTIDLLSYRGDHDHQFSCM